MRCRIPQSVAHVVTEGAADGSDGSGLRVSLLRLPDGIPVVLTEAAALIWLVAAEGAPNVVTDVAAGTGQAPDAIRQDVEAFVAELTAQGFLEPCDQLGHVDTEEL